MTTLITSLLVACGPGGDGTYEVSDQALQGTVGGQDWTYAQAHTNAFMSDDEAFWVEVFAETFEACSYDVPDPPSLIIAVPPRPGEYELSLGQNMTFVTGPGENVIGTQGILVVDEVTDETVSVSLFAEADDDNRVDGQFTATVCAKE